MRYIAHRGNHMVATDRENHPDYLLEALALGYDVEIDVWHVNDGWYFGHDEPTYFVSHDRLIQHFIFKCWLHCKNEMALHRLAFQYGVNYFAHNTDDFALVSNGHVWTCKVDTIIDTAVVMCVNPDDVSKVSKKIFAVCSDILPRITP